MDWIGLDWVMLSLF